MRETLAVVAATFAASLLAAPVPKSLKKPTADGLWQLVEYSSNGQSPPADAAEWRVKYWRVEGDRMTQGNVTLDEARKTTQMFTLRVRDPDHPHLREMAWDDNDRGASAVFELRGGRLVFCVANNDRTVVTEGKPAQGVYYHEFERVKVEK